MRFSLSWMAWRQRRRARRQGYTPALQRLEDRTVPGFAAPVGYNAGHGPQAVVASDFNGDGIPDLAIGNYDTRNTSILLGNGDGSFQPAGSFVVGQNPWSLAVGDFNGDGIPDLVTVGYRSMSVLLGTGDGSFQPALTFATGTLSYSVAVGDFNGDGIQDLALANYGASGGSVSILLGNGDGSFQPPRNFGTGAGSNFVAVGDVNGDGTADLVVADVVGNDVSVLLGNGDGSFQPARSFAAGTRPYALALADFNGDGVPDLAVVDSPISGSGTVSVLLGTGDGSFQPAQTFAVGSHPASVAVGDFNGDGRPDLAVADFGSSGQGSDIRVLLGTGDGSFQPAGTYAVGRSSVFVMAGDLNGDGALDLAVANQSSNDVSVLLGNGDGSFQSAPHFAAGIQPAAVALGDFNGDGIPDLAVANAGSNDVSVLLGNGDGSFQPAVTYAAGSDPQAIAVGDFNGDGIPDLAVANYGGGTITVLLGNGDGTFRATAPLGGGTHPNAIVVADFNGDGIPDLAIDNFDVNYRGSVSVFLGNGDGTFQDPRITTIPGAALEGMTVGDVNGDGIPDLALTAYYGDGFGYLKVLLGTGDGSFQALGTISAGPVSGPIALGDFNDDGIPDVAVADNDGTVRVLLGNGNGVFHSFQSIAVGSGAGPIVVGDFNGDGIPDLAVGAGGVSVLLGNGDGSFQAPPIRYIATSTESSLAAGDVNGDGQLDLAVAGPNSDDVTILLNDGLWPSSPAGARRRQPPHRPAKSAALVARPVADILHSDPTRQEAIDQALIALADSLSPGGWQLWRQGRE